MKIRFVTREILEAQNALMSPADRAGFRDALAIQLFGEEFKRINSLGMGRPDVPTLTDEAYQDAETMLKRRDHSCDADMEALLAQRNLDLVTIIASDLPTLALAALLMRHGGQLSIPLSEIKEYQDTVENIEVDGKTEEGVLTLRCVKKATP